MCKFIKRKTESVILSSDKSGRRIWGGEYPGEAVFCVYCESTDDIQSAIAREKQIKGWVRRKEAALIESMNAYWEDLAQGWDETSSPPQTLRPD